MWSISFLLLVGALIGILWHAINGKVPLWVPVLLMCLVMLLGYLPVK